MTLAVFLDRDGTINEEMGYIRTVTDLRLIPGAAQAIKRFNEAGILTILTTNQTGPARGFYEETHVQALNQRVVDLLQAEAGAHLDAIYYCPHLEKGCVPQYAIPCDCRKPAIGMVQQALQQFPGIELNRSYILGDKASDVEFAANAGCKGILLKTGYGQRVLEGKYQVLKVQPTWVCDDLLEAAETILKHLQEAASPL